MANAEDFPCLFWEQTKSTQIFEKIALFVCMKSHLRCGFMNILEKKREIFLHEVFIEVFLFQQTCPTLEISWLHACNFKHNFSPWLSS